MSPSGNMPIQPTARPPPSCRLESSTASKANRGNMTRQFPPRRSSAPHQAHLTLQSHGQQKHDGDDSSSVHAHRRPPRPREPTGCRPHSRTCPETRFLLPLDAAIRVRAVEGFGKRYLVGRPLAHLLPANRWACSGEIRKLRSGTGRRWKGDSKIALSSSESTS